MADCAQCGEGFTPSAVRTDQRYCSRACSRAAHNERRRGVPPEPKAQRPCYWCGRPFGYHPKLRTTYCSQACRQACDAAFNRVFSPPVLRRRRRLRVRCGSCEAWWSSPRRVPLCPPCARQKAWRTSNEARTLASKQRWDTTACTICGTVGVDHSTATCGPQCHEELRRRARMRKKSAERARRASVPRERYDRNDIFTRDRWRCGICGQPVDRNATCPEPLAPTIDHIIPVSRGGPDTPANVRCAHLSCNVRKGTGATHDQLRLLG